MRGFSLTLAIGKPVWMPQLEVSLPMIRITVFCFALWIVFDDMEFIAQDLIAWRKEQRLVTEAKKKALEDLANERQVRLPNEHKLPAYYHEPSGLAYDDVHDFDK